MGDSTIPRFADGEKQQKVGTLAVKGKRLSNPTLLISGLLDQAGSV